MISAKQINKLTIGLAVVAVILGYIIWARSNPKPSASRPAVPEFAFISPEERTAILNAPGQNASPEDQKRHAELVVSKAALAGFLEIAACDPKPLVLKVPFEKQFTVRNSDSVPHTIVIDPERTYSIPAKGELKITADFGKGPGIYGYGCDQRQEAAGMLFAVPVK